jgi:hypothetical protein
MAMANLIFDSFYEDVFKGNITFGTHSFKAMLVTDSYTPSLAHNRRDDITNEITGTGYTSGGITATPTVTLNTTLHRLEITWSVTTWTSVTITARGVVIYRSRGGAASADELVAAWTFGADVSITAGDYTVTIPEPMVFQNNS